MHFDHYVSLRLKTIILKLCYLWLAEVLNVFGAPIFLFIVSHLELNVSDG
jgi:hypothetical protein